MADIRRLFRDLGTGWLINFFRLSRRFQLFLILSIIACFLILMIAELENPTNESFRSPIDVVYWAVVSISTVGYGDITVRHAVSKILVVALIVTGVLLVSLMTATFASIFTATRIREGRGLKKIELRKHVVICGFNQNIYGVIQSIIDAADRAAPDIVLVNDQPESDFSDLAERFPAASLHFVYGDFAGEPTLLRAGIRDAASVIILADTGPGNGEKPDERTLLATLTIKSITKDPEVCAEVVDANNVPHLTRAGVDQTVVAGEFSGFFLANAVMSPGITQTFREIISIKSGSAIRRLPMPRVLVGRTFREAAVDFLERDGSILIGVITEKKSFNLDSILTAESDAIDSFIRRKFTEAGRSLEIESRGRFNVRVNPGREYVITEDDYAVILTPKLEEA